MTDRLENLGQLQIMKNYLQDQIDQAYAQNNESMVKKLINDYRFLQEKIAIVKNKVKPEVNDNMTASRKATIAALQEQINKLENGRDRAYSSGDFIFSNYYNTQLNKLKARQTILESDPEYKSMNQKLKGGWLFDPKSPVSIYGGMPYMDDSIDTIGRRYELVRDLVNDENAALMNELYTPYDEMCIDGFWNYDQDPIMDPLYVPLNSFCSDKKDVPIGTDRVSGLSKLDRERLQKLSERNEKLEEKPEKQRSNIKIGEHRKQKLKKEEYADIIGDLIYGDEEPQTDIPEKQRSNIRIGKHRKPKLKKEEYADIIGDIISGNQGPEFEVAEGGKKTDKERHEEILKKEKKLIQTSDAADTYKKQIIFQNIQAMDDLKRPITSQLFRNYNHAPDALNYGQFGLPTNVPYEHSEFYGNPSIPINTYMTDNYMRVRGSGSKYPGYPCACGSQRYNRPCMCD